jgi:hypothetical protein
MRNPLPKAAVTFTSERFRPVLPEDAQVNPGRYGAELAFWLCTELARDGVTTSYPNFEDWGWFIEYIVDEDEYWLCCGNEDGMDDRWRCFLRPLGRGLLGRNRAPVERARPLLEALARVLEREPSVRDVVWSDD